MRTLDLDAARRARAARRGETPALVMAGRRFELPPELPVDVFAPLLELNELELPLALRAGMDAFNKAREEGRADAETAAIMAGFDMLIDLLFQHRELPKAIIGAVTEMGRRLIGAEGMQALKEYRPSIPDLREMFTFVAQCYGVGLGESSPSGGGSPGGTTSERISSTTTGSISEVSGTAPAIPGSSESAISSPSPSGSHPML